ncbi:MAG TPA: hypothetical protein VJV05_01325 [Pyrinomonadaceae bacterium]|nr:hypothetical protein [Pyrinomonadaceae bacterium]
MKSILTLGLITFALTFCGLGDKLKQASSGSTGNSSSSSSSSSKTSSGSAERPAPTAEQQSIIDSSPEVTWEQQGISWHMPASFKKQQVMKESFNYGAPGVGFLIASISVMPDSFPSETSLEATHTQALEQLKQGKYEKVRLLEIDGVTGVEWVESMPEVKDGARRHQWIAFRRYLGQNQQLNIMVSTDGDKFDKQRDTFAAVMYSMKIPKG